MAEQRPVVVDHVAALAGLQTDNRVQDALRVRTSRREATVREVQRDVALSAPVVSSVLLEAVLLLGANGQAELNTQAVSVEYLKEDQKLVIPAALGMHWTTGTVGLVPVIAVLAARYRKVTKMAYREIRALVTSQANPALIQKHVDDMADCVVENRKVDWFLDQWYETAADQYDAQGEAVMTVFSQMLQFNCDIRDYGFLNGPNATVTDIQWRTADQEGLARTNCKLRPYTVLSTAAMNFEAVHSCELAAFIRAYGLAAGVLPDRTSRSQIEYKFRAAMPTSEVYNRLSGWCTHHDQYLYTLCLNFIAMFGLMHLNKDHTYRTNDAVMQRVGTSYMKTLKTIPSSDLFDTFENHREALTRTAAHPFGLGQTYWLAQVMYHHGGLAVALKIRHDTTPPPVQRLMVAYTGFLEWGSLPIGRHIQEMYQNEFNAIQGLVATIKGDPPAWSDLYRLYGLDVKNTLLEPVKAAIDAVMPAVYGFVMTVHVDENDKREGLGHALSLNNVLRDQGAQSRLWAAAWDKYYTKVDRQGLEEFITSMAQIRTAE